MPPDPSNFVRRGRDGKAIVPISAQALFEKQPPQALEAEMSLLGSMILDPRVIPDVLPFVRKSEDFYSESNGAIFKAIVDLYDQRNSGDLVQLVDMLRDRHVLDTIGGVGYLEQLAASVPTSVNAPHFAKIVGEKAKLRRLIDTAGSILYDAYHVGELGPEGAREVLDRAEMAVFEIAQEQAASDPQSLADLLELELQRIEAQDFGDGSMSGVATGYYDLDDKLRGLQPGELLVLAARPSMGKCLSADSEVVLRDGSIVTMESLHRLRCGEVATLGHDMRLAWTTPSAFIDDGRKPVFEVTTRLGRRVRTTLTHPFLSMQGWRPLGMLRVGEHIAVPRRIDAFGQGVLRDCEVKLLAYLIGDGGLTGTTPRFTNANERIASDFLSSVRAFGGVDAVRSDTRAHEAPSWRIVRQDDSVREDRARWHAQFALALTASGRTQRSIAQALGVSPASITHWMQGASVPSAPLRDACAAQLAAPHLASDDTQVRFDVPNAVASWLASLGLLGESSHTKAIPACVFTLRRDLLAMFLNRLFATDGWATTLRTGQVQLGYASVCEKLARQVQHLLLRFGIIASLRQRWVRYNQSRRSSWQLDITHAQSIHAFIEHVGIYGKEDALARAAASLAQRARTGDDAKTNRDLIPAAVCRQIEQAKGSASWAQLARASGIEHARGTNLHVGTRALSRGRLAKLVKGLRTLHDPTSADHLAGDLASHAAGHPTNTLINQLDALSTSDLYWDEIVSIEPLGLQQVYDITIDHTHNFVASDVCVHNTALALNLAEQMACGGISSGQTPTKRVPVGIFSLEMSKQALVQRMLSARSGVQGQLLRGGTRMGDKNLRDLMMAADELKAAPIYIDDSPDLTVLNLRARARRMVAQHGVKAIMIDYLQLMSAPGAARESRQVEVSTISRGVKALARELKVPILCLSQLNRASESREGNRPRMSDLRESGSIEQDADVILLLHREEYYHVQDESWKQENPDKVGIAEIIIAKQRNGPTGVVKLYWDNNTTRFKNYDAHMQAPGGVGGMGGMGGGGNDLGNPFHDAPRTSAPRAGQASAGTYGNAHYASPSGAAEAPPWTKPNMPGNMQVNMQGNTQQSNSPPQADAGFASAGFASTGFDEFDTDGEQPRESQSRENQSREIKPAPGTAFGNRAKKGIPDYHRDGGGSDQRPELSE
jgi:replicative DNA helicase